jgi:hypothetical protein
MQYKLALLVTLLPVLAHAAAIPRAAGGNLQTFTGALGGISAIPITNSGDAKRPFAVDGTTDVNIGAALQRSCSVQHNQCANAANANKNIGFSVSDCEQQQNQCNAAAQSGAQGAQGAQSNHGSADAASNPCQDIPGQGGQDTGTADQSSGAAD